MRALSGATLLAALAACAGPTASGSARAPASPAELARPESDPALLGTPRAGRLLPPTSEIAVRVRRGQAGEPVVVEFLSAGLTDADRVALLAALKAGRLRLVREGAAGEESWTTTLRPP